MKLLVGTIPTTFETLTPRPGREPKKPTDWPREDEDPAVRTGQVVARCADGDALGGGRRGPAVVDTVWPVKVWVHVPGCWSRSGSPGRCPPPRRCGWWWDSSSWTWSRPRSSRRKRRSSPPGTTRRRRQRWWDCPRPRQCSREAAVGASSGVMAIAAGTIQPSSGDRRPTVAVAEVDRSH